MQSTFYRKLLPLAAGLSIAEGVGASVSMAAALARGAIALDVGVIGIIIGFALLLRRPWARTCALWLSALGVAVCGAIAAWYCYLGESTLSDSGSGDWWPLLAGVARSAAVSLLVICTLWGRSCKAWFEASDPDPISPNAYGTAFVIVACYFLVGASIADWSRRRELGRMFLVDVVIYPVDGDTGGPLTSCGVSAFSGGMPEQPRFFPWIRSSISSGRDGMSVHIYGVAIGPYEATIGSKGYEDERVTLTRDSIDTMTLRMKKSANGKSTEPGATDNPDDAQRLREDH